MVMLTEVGGARLLWSVPFPRQGTLDSVRVKGAVFVPLSLCCKPYLYFSAMTDFNLEL